MLRDVLRAPLKLVFTSAAQRHHQPLTKWLIRRMDAVIATNERSASFLDVPHTVILHGVDLDKFHPAQGPDDAFSASGLPGEHAIGCFGRVRHQKGTDLFVDAMIALLPEFPDWTAVVTGRVTVEHQAFARELERRVAEAGLAERIVFLGEVPDIKPWYRRVSLYVAPSRNEGFGLTPLEAMASGSPVVASDAGAYADLIDEGVTGYVVPAGDGAALTEAIRKYLADPALLEAHRANALADVAQALSPARGGGGDRRGLRTALGRKSSRAVRLRSGCSAIATRPSSLTWRMVSAVRTVSTLGDEVSSSMTKVWNVLRSLATQCSRKSDSPDTIQASRTIGQARGAVGKGLQLGFRLVVEADQAEGDDVQAERRAVEHGAIAADDAAFLQPLDAAQAWRRRNADPARQFDIGDAAVVLQFAQDLPVDGIEIGLDGHAWLPRKILSRLLSRVTYRNATATPSRPRKHACSAKLSGEEHNRRLAVRMRATLKLQRDCDNACAGRRWPPQPEIFHDRQDTRLFSSSAPARPAIPPRSMRRAPC